MLYNQNLFFNVLFTNGFDLDEINIFGGKEVCSFYS